MNPEVPVPVDVPTTPPVPSARQTLSYLRRLFEEHSLECKSKLGQNYLIDLNLIDLAVKAGELTPEDAVLEVGTGTGSLTARLAEAAGAVCTIEIDHTFAPLARKIVGERDNVMFLIGDCLSKKSVLNPTMLSAWDAIAAKTGCTRRKLVANLPYSIATPLISNLLVDGPTMDRMVVMVQWEIAERMCAVPGTKEFNALSILIQSVADVSIVRKVAPSNFFPKPKVDSAIVQIVPQPAKRAII
ncbi:MAG: 16S rRNA (adenine(1518)-N(6)/adenine(1519)-N(6))-dimethyltransferase RsmA, partial [Gemmataceae bacterium]